MKLFLPSDKSRSDKRKKRYTSESAKKRWKTRSNVRIKKKCRGRRSAVLSISTSGGGRKS